MFASALPFEQHSPHFWHCIYYQNYISHMLFCSLFITRVFEEQPHHSRMLSHDANTSTIYTKVDLDFRHISHSKRKKTIRMLSIKLIHLCKNKHRLHNYLFNGRRGIILCYLFSDFPAFFIQKCHGLIVMMSKGKVYRR